MLLRRHHIPDQISPWLKVVWLMVRSCSRYSLTLFLNFQSSLAYSMSTRPSSPCSLLLKAKSEVEAAWLPMRFWLNSASRSYSGSLGCLALSTKTLSRMLSLTSEGGLRKT